MGSAAPDYQSAEYVQPARPLEAVVFEPPSVDADARGDALARPLRILCVLAAGAIMLLPWVRMRLGWFWSPAMGLRFRP